MPSSRVHFGARLWFGLVLVTLGVLWTLDNAGMIDAERIIRFWPLIFIAVGLSKLIGFGTPRRPTAGTIFLLLGVLFSIDQFDLFRWDAADAWPLFLIALGGLIVWRSARGPGRRWRHRNVRVYGTERVADAGGPADSDTFSCVAVWSGVDRKSTSQALRGGDFTAVMGGGELDLRGARAVPEGAEVEVLVVMGGLEVTVPDDWTVINDVQAVMGAVEDDRKSVAPVGTSTLRLKGFVMMGGVEIKNG